MGSSKKETAAVAENSYLTETNIPGLSHATASGRRSSSKIRKIIWIGLFIIGFFLTFYQVKSVLLEYFNYPVTTKVNQIFANSF